jgi:hypothetical protein
VQQLARALQVLGQPSLVPRRLRRHVAHARLSTLHQIRVNRFGLL